MKPSRCCFPLGEMIADQREERVEPIHHIQLLLLFALCQMQIKESAGSVLKRHFKGGDTAGQQMVNDEERDADEKQRKEECESLMKLGNKRLFHQ